MNALTRSLVDRLIDAVELYLNASPAGPTSTGRAGARVDASALRSLGAPATNTSPRAQSATAPS